MNYEVSLKERKGILYAHYYEGSRLIKKSLKLKATKPNIAYAQKHIIPNLQMRIAKGEKLFMESKISVFFERVEKRLEGKAPATRALYMLGIRYFFKYFQDKDIRSFTVAELDKYVDYLYSMVSATSVKLYLVPVNMAFDEAIRQQIMTINLLKYAIKPKCVKKERKAYTITQVFRLLEAAEGRLKTFMYIEFFTGMRAGEILALDWSDIDLEKRQISVTKSKSDNFGIGQTKSRKNRRIPIINKLYDYLVAIKQEEGRIFIGGYKEYRLAFKKLCNEIGFFYEGTHNMRHTFASLMLQAKESPLLVKEFLGHANLTMINTVYAHYLEDKQDCTRFGAILEQYG